MQLKQLFITDPLRPSRLLFLVRPLLAILLLSCGMVSCKKSENLGDPSQIVGLGGDTSVPTAIDKWISDSLTTPYNISVQYKWDQADLDLSKTLVPPIESQIVPVMGAIKKVWIDTYVAEAGLDFFKKLCPKYFILAGSPSYNVDGTITLGTAEGGRKIVLYVLNYFRIKGMPGFVPSDSVIAKMQFHTIEHEFGHILHQNVLYPVAFKSIDAGFYTANWNNVSDAVANEDGFISAYAMSAYDEDFVEMISIMLTEGRDGFDRIVNGITQTSPNGTSPATAQSRLRQKETIVVNYFKDIWNIDFYALQTLVRAQIVALTQ